MRIIPMKNIRYASCYDSAVHLKLLGITYHEDEIPRLIQLRTLEWDAFPVFATRSLAPLAMFWMPWWEPMLLLATASLIWCPIRNHVALPAVSVAAALLNMAIVALLANVIIAILLFANGRFLEGGIALIWQLITTVVSFAYPPSRDPALQSKFLSRISGAGFVS